MIGFTRLDWLIAWRHLRTADERPVWLWPLIVIALYLLAVGAIMAWHASSLQGAEPAGVGTLDAVGPDLGPTPLERYYGSLAGVTIAVGAMALVFGLLSWAFALLPTIITMSVLLGCMALVVVLSLMSGLEADLRDKILAQKAHIRVATSDSRPFSDYASLTDAVAAGQGIAGATPYLEGEIMVRSGLNRQGAILLGILPERQNDVSNLRTLVREGDYEWLEHPEEIPEPDPFAIEDEGTPWRLRHLDAERKKKPPPPPPAGAPGPDDGALRGAAPAGTPTRPEGVDAPPEGPEPPPSLGVVGNKLPTLIPPPDDEEDTDDTGDGGDDGWEDPAQELQGVKPTSGAFDGPSNGLLRALPPPPALPSHEQGGDDGWEDPAQEIPKLREEGELPGGSKGGGSKASAPPPDESEPDESEPDDVALEDGSEPEAVLDPLLVGRELAMELGIGVGSEVQLINAVGRMTPAGEIPGVLGAKVAGVFFSGMYEYDRKNVYVPLDVAQRFLLTGDRVSGIEVKLVHIEDIDAGKAEVERIVAASGRTDLVVQDWRDLNRNLFSAMFLEKVAMFIALLFVVLVASFGILASNLMSVMEKSKEIAILKAMGIGDRGILRVFIAEGLAVGLLGGFGGIAMGLTLCETLDRYGLPLNENVYYIEKLPVVVNPFEVALVGVAALVIVCLSSLYPALVASRLRPVDALRHGDQ